MTRTRIGWDNPCPRTGCAPTCAHESCAVSGRTVKTRPLNGTRARHVPYTVMNDHLPLSQLVRKNLLALGSAAVLTVYSAGYVKTREAAAKFDGEDAERRPAPPVAQRPSNREALPPLAAVPRPREQQPQRQPQRQPQGQPQRGAAENAESRANSSISVAHTRARHIVKRSSCSVSAAPRSPRLL